MNIKSIKKHLLPYSIMGKRQTTINHAFASAIAPNDVYNDKIMDEAIRILGQNPAKDLSCVYCGELAETWDHVFGLVKNYKFSGYGHVIGNLLPCCKECNSEKGNRDWKDFIRTKLDFDSRSKIISQYLSKYLPVMIDYDRIQRICPDEISNLENIKNKIFRLMEEADGIAVKVREKITGARGS